MTADEPNHGRAMMLALFVGAVLGASVSVPVERWAGSDTNCVIEDCSTAYVVIIGAPAAVLAATLLLIRRSVGRLPSWFYVLLVLVVTTGCYAWPLVTEIAEVPEDAVADELKGVLGVIAVALFSLLPSTVVVVLARVWSRSRQSP